MCMLCNRCLSFSPFSFDHCVVCSSSIYCFWLPLWYLLTIVLYVLLRFTASDYPFGIFWPLCCMFFFDLRILITPLVSPHFSYISITNERERESILQIDISFSQVARHFKNNCTCQMESQVCWNITQSPLYHIRFECGEWNHIKLGGNFYQGTLIKKLQNRHLLFICHHLGELQFLLLASFFVINGVLI
jgi:hypothetical protein